MAQSATEDMLSIALMVGNWPITGLAGSGAIRYVKTQPDFTMRSGVGGLMSFTRIIDDTGTLSVDLLPTSDGNDALTLMIKFAKARLNGSNFKVSLIDTTGRFSLVTASAAIMKQPDPTIGDGSGINTWDFIGVWSQNSGGRGATPISTFEDVPGLASLPGTRLAI